MVSMNQLQHTDIKRHPDAGLSREWLRAGSSERPDKIVSVAIYGPMKLMIKRTLWRALRGARWQSG